MERRQEAGEGDQAKAGGGLGKEVRDLEGGEDGFMDTGTGRSVGIGLSVLWYRVIVQRKHRVVISYSNLETSRSC